MSKKKVLTIYFHSVKSASNEMLFERKVFKGT